MIVFPNAKINIGLNIVARRPDGYHDIESIMYPIGWCDILEIVPAGGVDTTLTVTGRSVDCPMEKNLVMKAYRRMARELPLPPVDIYLHKIIPDGAGLGGGSSDASFTLTALNDMFALGFDKDKLAGMAADIGADCPFFIYNRPMSASGTGTDLSPADVSLGGYGIVVVKPDAYVSTAEAYAGVSPQPSKISLADTVRSTAPSQWTGHGVVNDFERTVIARCPVIETVKNRLTEAGAVYVSMSGSGSAVYGLFADDKLAEKAAGSFDGLPTFAGSLK